MYPGLYISLLATTISIIGLTSIAYRAHKQAPGKTLSVFAASSKKTTVEFGAILVVCGLLFLAAMNLYILPDLGANSLLWIVWLIVIASELVTAFLPANNGRSLRAHNVISRVMAAGMLVLAILMMFYVSGPSLVFATLIALSMFILVLFGIFNKQKFLYYELPFIFLSHLSVVNAALWIASQNTLS